MVVTIIGLHTLYIANLLIALAGSDVSIGLLRKTDKIPKPSEYGNRPRGVPYARGPFYATGETFACMDNSLTIPFSQVNDDYCDCTDGSDEPGTSACPNGKFHCLNRGFHAEDIPSSRVNDQICDCCDGSDEWDSAIDCPNICNEAGAKYREEKRQKAELAKKGYAKRIQLAAAGQELKAEKLKTLETLRKEKEELIKLKNEAENKMNEKVSIEAEARKKHDDLWEEEKKKLKQEFAQILFTSFDKNLDGVISVEELKLVKEFDTNKDGSVSDEEIKVILPNGEPSCDFKAFSEGVYDHIHHYFEKTEEIERTETENEEAVNLPVSSETVSESPDNIWNDSEGRNGSSEDHFEYMSPRIPNIELKKPAFSEETQALIKDAEDAKAQFEDIKKRYGDLELSVKDAEFYAGDNFGVDLAWATLTGKCVEIDQNEYIYKLCLFDKALQRSKSSTFETDLGRWSSWAGDDSNKYSMQKYENGTPCWNGPDRSTKVLVECGEETELVEALEPNKCEYLFTLRSPAACPDPDSIDDQHEEL